MRRHTGVHDRRFSSLAMFFSFLRAGATRLTRYPVPAWTNGGQLQGRLNPVVHMRQDASEPTLSISNYLAQPQPIFYLREFGDFLLSQEFNGHVLSQHCAAQWLSVQRTGLTGLWVDHGLTEFKWRLLDWAEAATQRATGGRYPPPPAAPFGRHRECPYPRGDGEQP